MVDIWIETGCVKKDTVKSDSTNLTEGCWEEEEEEVFITSGNWRGKHNSLSRGAISKPNSARPAANLR